MRKTFCLLLCLCLLPLAVPGLAYSRMDELGAWEAFAADSGWRGAAYDNLYHSAQQGIILVVLRPQAGGQWLTELRRLDGRWQMTRQQRFECCLGQTGHLYIMNSEEAEMPELVHSHFDAGGRGYHESFWFVQEGGEFVFKEAALHLPFEGEPASESIMRLSQTGQGIEQQAYHYVLDSVEGPQKAGEAMHFHQQTGLTLWSDIHDYPRGDFLVLLAANGIFFGKPEHMPKDLETWLCDSAYVTWEVTGFAQPEGDIAFLALKQGPVNQLVCLKLSDKGWALDYENDQALPQGPEKMLLQDVTGGSLLAPYQDAGGQLKEHYGKALQSFSTNGEYYVHHSIWEKDASGRWLLAFYGDQGQAGMMQFDTGRMRYVEGPMDLVWQASALERDLRRFRLDSLPDPYQRGLAPVTTGVAVTAVVQTEKPGNRLNLRVKPDQRADMIARYYTGTPVTILQDDGGQWVKVSIGWDREGWVMRKFLVFWEAQHQVQPAMHVYTMHGPWQLRYEPFDQSHIKQSFPGGEQVEVMGLTNGWWHVRMKNSQEDWGFVRELEAL